VPKEEFDQLRESFSELGNRAVRQLWLALDLIAW